MNSIPFRLATATLAAVVAALSGCSKPPTISLRYSRDAEYRIPTGVKRLAIAQFSGKSERDAKWAEIASDKLASAIDDAGRHERRFEQLERKRLKEIVDEQDLQTVAGDAAATRLGKLAGADAVIYGTVHVVTEEKLRQRPLGSSFHRHRFVMVSITYYMVDVNTARRLASTTIKREYDSSKAHGGKTLKMLEEAVIGIDALPVDKAIDDLADKCTRGFVGRIAPHEVTVTVALEKGKNGKLVGAGNKLAGTGEYVAALAYYEQAIARNPRDHGAIFNAGAMYEARRQFGKAATLYKKAFDLVAEQKFADAWNRVRREGHGD